MSWIALKMLFSNRGKYIGIVMGITFASLLIAQQASIFYGIMLRTGSQIRDIQGCNMWVMDENLQFIDDIKPMSENELYRVRGVPGVDWAVRFYKGLSRARMPNGNYQQVILLGLDDAGMVGAPKQILMGSLDNLRQPDAIFMDESGFKQIWSNEPLTLGKTLEMNDHRAVLVGICKAGRTWQTFPVVYTRFSQAIQFVPSERKVLSFVLAQSKPGHDTEQVCQAVNRQTGLLALTPKQFAWKTMKYYLTKTGIPVNFGTTVLLGFLVGTAIAGQTFYLFTLENLRQFGTLKAMGATNMRLLKMIILQAMVVGFLGYCIGVGLAAIFGYVTLPANKLAFNMPWEVLVGTGLAVGVIITLSSLMSIRKVMVLEPAIVFRG